MARTKIDYGIDLGTTNSALARMESGEPKIIKSDQSKDIIPSCVGFNKKKNILVGDSAEKLYRSDKLKAVSKSIEPNTFIEFKRTMGTDKIYHSSYMEQDFNSEELSAEVLKKLRSFITDENFETAVITVPAKFDIRQQDATLRAAKLAGFKYAELLQEPVAASMAYGLDTKSKNGFWVVFDFGGGTFDAALVKVEDGIMKVVDTDGDNYLGGKNLDYAIVDEILIPHLSQKFSIQSHLDDDRSRSIFRDGLKPFAEEAKNQLSFKDSYELYYEDTSLEWEDDEGEEIEIDLTVTKDSLQNVIAPIFQKAVDATKDLIKRNNLTGGKLESLILVGGPTHSPILREMLEMQIKKPDTSADPMTAVATGAALYASTMDVSDEIKEASRDKTKVQLDIGYESQTIETEEWVTLKILPEKTEGEIPEKVFAEIVRADKAWSSGKVAINEKGEIIEAKLNQGSNSFKVDLYDDSGNRLEGQPDSFLIIAGTKVDKMTLPHNIGLEIKSRKDAKLIFTTVKGLEINQPLPATGTKNGLRTQKQIRPGNSQDIIKIPIYQGDYYSEGTRALYNEHVYDAKITGDDLPALLPENSEVDITLTTNKSGRIEKIEAFFPYLDHTADIAIPEDVMSEIDAAFLENEIRKAKGSLTELGSNGHANSQEIKAIEKEIDSLNSRLDQGRNDYDRKKEVLDNLRKSLKQIDDLNENIEWPKLEAELREEFDRLEKANNELGNEKTSQHVNQLRTQVDEVIRKKDVKVGQALLEEIHNLFFAMTFIYQLIGFVHQHSENFGSFHWRDPQRARQLINQAEQVIAENPTKERLHPIVIDLINELPPEERSQPGGDDEVLEM